MVVLDVWFTKAFLEHDIFAFSNVSFCQQLGVSWCLKVALELGTCSPRRVSWSIRSSSTGPRCPPWPVTRWPAVHCRCRPCPRRPRWGTRTETNKHTGKTSVFSKKTPEDHDLVDQFWLINTRSERFENNKSTGSSSSTSHGRLVGSIWKSSPQMSEVQFLTTPANLQLIIGLAHFSRWTSVLPLAVKFRPCVIIGSASGNGFTAHQIWSKIVDASNHRKKNREDEDLFFALNSQPPLRLSHGVVGLQKGRRGAGGDERRARKNHVFRGLSSNT